MRFKSEHEEPKAGLGTRSVRRLQPEVVLTLRPRKAATVNVKVEEDDDTMPSTPPRGNPRRVTTSGGPHKREASVSFDEEKLASPSRRRKLAIVSDSDEGDASDADDSASGRVKVASPLKRRKLAIVTSDSDEGDASDADDSASGKVKVVSPLKRRKLAIAASDSDNDHTLRKRICPIKLEVDDSDIEKAADDRSSTADSADVDDLELPPAPTPSRPTKKEVHRTAIETLKNKRENKSSPATAHRTQIVGSDDESLAWQSDPTDSESDRDTDSEGESSEQDSFIDDTEQTVEADADLKAALGPEYYARRDLDEQFVSFVEFLVRLHLDPEVLSADDVSENERWSYEAALRIMRQRTEAVADSMQVSTWSTPFRATLDRRPTLSSVSCKSNDPDCQACWTRGPMSCSAAGCYKLTTLKGFYNRKTFQEEPEEDVTYGYGTTRSFENSADVETFLYKPGSRLIVGARCAHKAVAYHQARHYLYNMFIRVKDEIERVCDEDSELDGNKDRLVKALNEKTENHESFASELWRDFVQESAEWQNFTGVTER
ncbi:DUF4211 domain-containing protein [Mycena venus]|uniref:DUF4211 domain-containing protein n=1 Tax=Mycena venus TaxID=2733690 RepID=A0A8H6Y3Y1_9AGAR|nr:DUF4211 domain-containing protein [Mycena venus]